MASGRKHFALRIDPALWEELEAWAQDELRSVNGQIEYILREAVKKRRSRLTPEGPGAHPPPQPETTRELNGSA